MKKILKYVLLALVAVALVFAALVTYILVAVNPNDYKPQIIKLVKEKTQRNLKIGGDIKLTIFPSIGADINKIALSEYRSEREFASIDRAHVSVALIPLLSKRIVVNEVELSGAKADLIEYRDGKLNIDDLISHGAEPEKTQPAKPEAPARRTAGAPLALDIASVSVDHTSLTYRDEATGAHYAVKDLHVKTGRLGSGSPTPLEMGVTLTGNKPKVDLVAQLKAMVTLDLAKQIYRAQGLDLQVTGEAAGIRNLKLTANGDVSADMKSGELGAKQFVVDVSGVQNTNNLTARLSLPGVETKGQTFRISDLALNAEMRQPDQAFKVKLDTPVEGNLESQRFTLSGLKLALNATGDKLPNKSVSSELGGNVQMDLKKQAVDVHLDGGLLQSKIKADASVNGFAHPAIRFKADIDQFDADLYLPKKKAGATTGAAPGAAEAPEQAFDLSALRDLDVDGSLTLGALKVLNIKASQLRVAVKAQRGEVAVPMSLNLYKGSAKLDAKVNAVPAKPVFAVRGDLAGVEVGPLAKDAANLDIIEGRGNIALNLTTQGNLVSALKKGLGGTMGVNLRNGAVKGINLQKLVQGLQRLSKNTRQESLGVGKEEKTAFTEFRANFKVHDGVAHNSDLSIKAPPTVHVTGSGDVDIGNSTVNYTTKVTFAKTAHGGSGTLPVYLSGPFTDLKYRVDLGALAASVVKQKLEAKKEKAQEEIKSKAREELKKGLRNLFK
ncbi:MAG TPA: AsmA family protein [Gallionellaceae bacterium]|nr:AsmA family protein [Gallionellaceae bacterium]